jgi:hypothetical protein
VIDDDSLTMCNIAKRAYLHTLAFPPAILTSSNGTSGTIRPYDGPDAQTIIQTVNTRSQQHNPSHSRSHTQRAASISVFPTSRSASGSAAAAAAMVHPSNSYRNNSQSNARPQLIIGPEHQPPRDSSPVLPSLPSHPTLNSLISFSLGETVASASSPDSHPPSDPAILAAGMQTSDLAGAAGGPRIGDPGKRMLGAALGVRHPSLGPRMVNGNGTPPQGGNIDHVVMHDVQRAMGGLVVTE